MERIKNTPKPEAEYEVGYCRPPKSAQFKPGQSGNPDGTNGNRKHVERRRKLFGTFSEMLDTMSGLVVEITERRGKSGRLMKRKVRLTKGEAMIYLMLQAATDSESVDRRFNLALMQYHDGQIDHEEMLKAQGDDGENAESLARNALAMMLEADQTVPAFTKAVPANVETPEPEAKPKAKKKSPASKRGRKKKTSTTRKRKRRKKSTK